MKPDKVPFFEFYIAPIGDAVCNLVTSLWHLIIGAWWCDHCGKYHGRRVRQFRIFKPFSAYDNVCSLGVAARKKEGQHES